MPIFVRWPQIKVDTENEQVVLGGGVRFREFIEALAAEGQAALTGDCPTVGAPPALSGSFVVFEKLFGCQMAASRYHRWGLQRKE